MRWRTSWSSPTSRSPATTPSSTRRPTAASRSATWARTTARTSTASRSPRAARQLLGPNDIVGVGHSTFRLVGDRLEEFVDTGEVSFSARHLTVTVDGGKQILKDVSFGVPEKSLIAVIGPSGSGKSTLLKALTGYRPANQGDVLYDNRNLYKQFAELRQRIGLVPQDDILHKELTVKKALKYAAKLRFPADTTTAEREARIDEVLRELKLDIHKEKKVTSLSGGQRKRVSVALELLTKPSLIFLDEPTSGLDPGMDRDVMQLLRGLADDGRTVLVVTHSVAELAICDKLLVMAPGGSVAYFGPPEEALNFFGYDTWADVFSAFENYRDYDWAGRWKGSQHYQMYAADIDAVAPQSVQMPPMQAMKPPKPQGWMSQFVHPGAPLHLGHRLRQGLPGPDGDPAARPRLGEPAHRLGQRPAAQPDDQPGHRTARPERHGHHGPADPRGRRLLRRRRQLRP